jgi:hypothetical protein
MLVRYEKKKELLAKKKAKKTFVIPGSRKKLKDEDAQKAGARKIKTVRFLADAPVDNKSLE